jgi:hypothetical protein
MMPAAPWPIADFDLFHLDDPQKLHSTSLGLTSLRQQPAHRLEQKRK